MEKKRRNFSLSRKAVSRRNLKKIKSYLNIFSYRPNVPFPNNYLEPLPERSSNIPINHEFSKRFEDSEPSYSHDNIGENVAINSEFSFCNNDYSDVENGDNDFSDDDDNRNSGDRQIAQKKDQDEKMQCCVNSYSNNTNFTLFNVPNSFTSNILMIPNRYTTVKEHLLSVVTLSLRHHWSYEAILDTYRYTNISYGTMQLPTTKIAFWKALGRNDDNITRYFYCRECNDFFGEKSSITNQLQRHCCCNSCGPNKPNTHEGYFLYNTISSQIQQLLAVPSIVDALKYRFERPKCHTESLEDIYDGAEYQKLSSSGILKDWYNLSLTFNTDGCKVANSSNASVWPILAQINELPPHLRKKHMLLVAVYVDLKHPLMNNFLRPFIDELRQLYEDGVTWKLSDTEEITSKIIVTTSSLDAPAKCAVTRMTQFNGYFSCLYCYSKGKSVKRGKLVFPVEQSFKKLREKCELETDMDKACKTGVIINGVKGFSSLCALPLFDISKGVVGEAMHAVYLGVVKQHMTLLLDTTAAPYYIGSSNSCRLIDNCLLSIKPPSRHSRKPRSISTYKQWKASQWRNWLEYAAVCLKEVLKEKYVNHIALLSEAIYYLNNDSITFSELNHAEKLLKKYVQLFQKYFGVNNMSSNLHLLTHIVETVRN